MLKSDKNIEFPIISKSVVLTALFVIFLSGSLYSSALANEYGTIYGEIRDAETNEVLPGASVIIKGSLTGITSDVDGRYTLRRVPSGSVTLEIIYMGYAKKEIQLTLEPDQRLEVNVLLDAVFIQGAEIIIQAQQRGQSRALTQQRQSANIRTVVSAEQLDQFVDGTVSGALQRVAGMGHGGTNIRGVGAGSANITMDGQRMGSTGDDRSVDVSTISADMIDQIEVVKVITPDMDADALSGTININTRRPIGGQKTMNVRMGGGINTRYANRTGPSGRFSFSFGDSPADNFSYGFNISYLRSVDASEHVRTDWSWSNFPQIEGPSDILTSFRSGLSLDPRDRISAGAQFTFQSTSRTTFYVMTNVNYEKRLQELHETRWSFEEFFSPLETRGFEDVGRAGDMSYQANLNESDINQYTARVGARHLFDRFELEYKLGWGYGKSSIDRYRPLYGTLKAFENTLNFDNGRGYPIIEVLPSSLIKQYPVKSDFFNRNNEEASWDFHQNSDYTVSYDINIPYRLGSFKFGSSGIYSKTDGISERYLLRYQRQLYLNFFDDYLGESYNVFDRLHETYRLPFLVDVHRMRDFNRTYRPHYNLDLEALAITAGLSFYDAREYTLATYGMTTINLSKFKILGGIRVEYTDSKYIGRAGVISEEEKFRGAVDTVGVNNYLHLFPNAQLIYALDNMTNLRLAYSRSIGRPNLKQLSPNVIWDYSSRRITEGNSNLNPMISNNVDFLFEHYFMNVGQFTVGVFYKFLRDFIFNYDEIISPDGIDGQGLYALWRRTTLRNAETADVYGLELTWQQNLSFLPGFLGNLGVYSNYSYSMSEADIKRPEGPVRLQGQREHVVNAGVSYTQARFSGQLSYAWGSPSISAYGNLDFAPSIFGDSKRVYMDQYRDALNNLSMTMQYRLTESFRIWADADNLMNNINVDYVYNQSSYPTVQTLRGRTFNLGLRYTF